MEGELKINSKEVRQMVEDWVHQNALPFTSIITTIRTKGYSTDDPALVVEFTTTNEEERSLNGSETD